MAKRCSFWFPLKPSRRRFSTLEQRNDEPPTRKSRGSSRKAGVSTLPLKPAKLISFERRLYMGGSSLFRGPPKWCWERTLPNRAWLVDGVWFVLENQKATDHGAFRAHLRKLKDACLKAGYEITVPCVPRVHSVAQDTARHQLSQFAMESALAFFHRSTFPPFFLYHLFFNKTASPHPV